VRRKKSAAPEEAAQVGGLGNRPAFTGWESLTFRVNNPLSFGRNAGFVEEFRGGRVNSSSKRQQKQVRAK
jgi:hypothetical protein